jgi:sugar phosphate isomerase/epimerase
MTKFSIRVGLDGRKYPGNAELGAFGLLDKAKETGTDGVFFRTVLDIAPTLDDGFLGEVAAHARSLGLYLEMGLGKVNPYNTAEAPEVRAIGNGDYLLGMTRMIEAVTAIGCTALWADTANFQRFEWGRFAIDRFRTDVTWNEQLLATQRFIEKLRPVLVERGAAIALETHEEITTYEIVRMIEAAGSDILGVTLDLANVVVRGEEPVAATRRVAPYVLKTHMRDLILYPGPNGFQRQIRAIGDGSIDWHAVLGAIRDAGATPNMTIENSWHDRNEIALDDPQWRSGHPDLTIAEVDALKAMAARFADEVAKGLKPAPDDYYGSSALPTPESFIPRSAATLREVAAALA